MLTVDKSIEINAPVEKVFGYIRNVATMPEIWPSLEEVTNVQALPNGGHSYDWQYKMAGLRFHGHSEDELVEDRKRIVERGTGGIESRISWAFEQLTPDTTRVTSHIEYTVPIPVIGRLAESMVHRMNEREAEVLLANLKIRMEA
jgi:uncharacterized membrane protein